MLYVVLTMVFLSTVFLVYAALGAVLRKRQVIAIRLEKIAKEDSRYPDSDLNKPLFARIVQPILDDISKLILKVTPKEIISNYEKRVITAGNPFDFTVKDWMNIQAAVILCFPLITVLIGVYKKAEVRTVIFVALVEIIIGLILPRLLLSKKTSDRQREIKNSLPDVLDLLTVSVEAGLGFDGALAKVIDKMPGALANEFENVLQEMKVGKQKKDALKDMADRVGLNDLITFIGSIIQADQLGVSISNVLRIQSEQMRQKRRQRAQEKAMKAPVKMLIPMVLFIFPTIFSVLIGPVAIKVIRTFLNR